MGAHGISTFDEDHAADWLADLCEQEDPKDFYRECLDLDGIEYLEMMESSGVIGTCVIIDGILNGKPPDLPDASSANSKFAEDEPEIEAACAGCINAGLVQKDDYAVAEVQGIINAFAIDKAKVTQKYHRIPNIPLMMQYDDWPMCCGDWCEFFGTPSDYEESVRIPSQHQFWDRRPVKPHWDFELKPESFSEICLFRCRSCDKTYFIWQPT